MPKMEDAGKSAGWGNDAKSSKGTAHRLHDSFSSFSFVRCLGRVRSSRALGVCRNLGWHLGHLIESVAWGPMLVRREMVRLMRA